jgi:hypothetical protein
MIHVPIGTDQAIRHAKIMPFTRPPGRSTSMATQVQVKLDTSATPPVTVIPQRTTVNSGSQTIDWTPFATQTFSFVSLTFKTTPNPFAVTVTTSKVTATEDNQAAGDFTYVVVVSQNGVQYSSAATGIARTGGTPVIHNN